MTGAVAMVTGGGGGIGGVIAETPAARGDRVVVADPDLASVARVADRVGGLAVGFAERVEDATERVRRFMVNGFAARPPPGWGRRRERR
ncbi:hypothetical protein [Saccharothrix xinjiangensis]|uniref:Short subunit dehydrogenase n=1 Tax=Saccharothrix xinjiangensis TaxID=204798 RepID=A0ABV9Y3N9_9PSEU